MWVRTKTVIHKRDECIGCGSCVFIAPRQRHMDYSDGKASLAGAQWKGKQYMVAQVDEDSIPVNREAADACPVQIIRISW